MKTQPPFLSALFAFSALKDCVTICASSSDEIVAIAAAAAIDVPSDPSQPIPSEFVWMPAGEHEISAHMANGGSWKGKVLCDEAGFRAVAAKFSEITAAGFRVPLDKNHENADATAWIEGFRWDAARGILCRVSWTALGETLLRGRVFRSFSPAFTLNKKTARVAGFPPGGNAAGGLVNAPAFGAAMPALIAARLSGAEIINPASGGTPVTRKTSHMNKELLVSILAALAVQHSADASEEQLTQLLASHKDKLTTACTTNAELKAKADQLASIQAKAATEHAELVALRAKDAARRTADAKAAVDAAVARGALPAKDEAIQAKWRGMIEANPDHAELLASLPDNPALRRVTSPAGIVVGAKDGLLECLRAMNKISLASVDERAAVYGADVAPLFAKDADFGRNLATILAANSLGTLAGELVSQRSLSLLKYSFPWLSLISTDFSAEGGAFNQTVKVRLRTVPGLADYVPGTGYTRQNAGTSDVDVVINAHKGVEIAFNANELSSGNRDLFGEQVEGCHYALGLGLADAVLAVITVANFANETIKATANVDATTMDDIDAALAGRGVIGPRIGLLSSPVFRKLGRDTSIVTLAAYRREEILTEGTLPKVKGVMPYEVHHMPTPAGENLTGFVGTSSSLALAARPPADYTQGAGAAGVNGNGIVQVVKNPDTGIYAQLVRYVDHKAAESAWRLALMWGAGKGNPAAGQRLISGARA